VVQASPGREINMLGFVLAGVVVGAVLGYFMSSKAA
jgi:F0F1-type ATP synthase assembly protein I